MIFLTHLDCGENPTGSPTVLNQTKPEAWLCVEHKGLILPTLGELPASEWGFYSREVDQPTVWFYTVKMLAVFLSPAGMSLTKLSLAGKNSIILGQGEFGKWHAAWGRENRLTFLQCSFIQHRYLYPGQRFFGTYHTGLYTLLSSICSKCIFNVGHPAEA